MLQPKPAHLPEPSATGSLAKKPLAHLLIYALDRKLNGTFELGDEGGAAVHIVVSKGGVARVGTSESVTFLGHVLYESGFIDDTQLSSSLAEVAASKRLHGQVLLDQGLIDREQLAEGLRQQRSRKLQHAFALSPQTTFAFYSDVDLVGERPDDVEPMDPLTCIWRGVREHPSWDHVRATISRIGGRPVRLRNDIDLARPRARRRRARGGRVPPDEGVHGAGAGDRRGLCTIQATDLLAVLPRHHEARRARGARPGGVQGVRRPQPSGPPMRINTPGVGFASGEYVRKISFTMSAVTPDSGTIRIPSPVPNRIPSPMPGRLSSPAPREDSRRRVPRGASRRRCRVRAVARAGARRRSPATLPQAKNPVLPADVSAALPPRRAASHAASGTTNSSMPPDARISRARSRSSIAPGGSTRRTTSRCS